jgi:hypothetical protein
MNDFVEKIIVQQVLSTYGIKIPKSQFPEWQSST